LPLRRADIVTSDSAMMKPTMTAQETLRSAYSLTTKSGTNEMHFYEEERYINKDWLHRQVFN
jgi:hypothetical protein